MHTTGMLTDRYELTMLTALLADGTAHHPATFEVFTRSFPNGTRYGVFAGLDRLLDALDAFTFTPTDIAYLLDTGAIDQHTADYLTDFRFTGTINAYREGDVFFPHSPLLTITGTLGECILIETLTLSILNHDTAIATKASRIHNAAAGRPLIEMGSRRTHERAAVGAARAAYIAGFSATSNLAAGARYTIPTVGTAAHAFTLAHRSEADAFAAQIAAHGTSTTLLVDTYDIPTGIRTAVEAARAAGAPGPGAIRIDSGILSTEATQARRLLNSLGAHQTRITATSDLDEDTIADLVHTKAPIDGFGVGTRLVTAPPPGLVYKLVAIADSPDPDAPQRAVAKKSRHKGSTGGRKYPWRLHSPRDEIVAETYTATPTMPDPDSVPLHREVMTAGRITGRVSVEESRRVHAEAITRLPARARDLFPGSAYLTATPVTAPEPAREDHDHMDQRTALLVIDVQNDFCEGGSLAVTGGHQVAADISTHLATHHDDYALIVATRDWHDPDSTNNDHFAERGTDPDYMTTWPVHCVAETHGADYAPQLDTRHIHMHLRKGQGEPAYSGFEATTFTHGDSLDALLKANHITDLVVVGIATDYCVKATVLDGLAAGYPVTLLDGLHAGVAPETTAQALAAMTAAGATTQAAQTTQVAPATSAPATTA